MLLQPSARIQQTASEACRWWVEATSMDTIAMADLSSRKWTDLFTEIGLKVRKIGVDE